MRNHTLVFAPYQHDANVGAAVLRALADPRGRVRNSSEIELLYREVQREVCAERETYLHETYALAGRVVAISAMAQYRYEQELALAALEAPQPLKKPSGSVRPRRPKAAPDPDTMEVGELAPLLHLSPVTVRLHSAAGIIPGRQIGNRWRYSRAAITEWRRGSAA